MSTSPSALLELLARRLVALLQGEDVGRRLDRLDALACRSRIENELRPLMQIGSISAPRLCGNFSQKSLGGIIN